jgi:hypothetical protein
MSSHKSLADKRFGMLLICSRLAHTSGARGGVEGVTMSRDTT